MVSNSTWKLCCIYDTLYTRPKPLSPSLLDKAKFFVAILSFRKPNSNNSCNLACDSFPIMSSLGMNFWGSTFIKQSESFVLHFICWFGWVVWSLSPHDICTNYNIGSSYYHYNCNDDCFVSSSLYITNSIIIKE